MSGRDEVFDITAYPDFTPAARGGEIVPYRLAPAPIAVPDRPLTVVHDEQGRASYAVVLAAQPQAVDPWPQRMLGFGVAAFGTGVGVGVAELGSYWMFKGMSLAGHALVAIAAMVVCAAGALYVAKLDSEVRVDVRQGDGANLHIGR